MNIQEKFTKILETNDLNIKSIHGLEKFSGVGIGSISKFLNAGEGPSLGTIKKIHASLGINPEWWKTGKGDIYIKKGTSLSMAREPENPPYTDDWGILIKTIDRIGATNEYLIKRVNDLESGKG